MPDLRFFVLRLPIMSVRPKRQKLSEQEISDIFHESSDFSNFKDESDESESEISDESSSDDAMATSSDWSSSGKERAPFNFSCESGVKFTVTNKNNPLEFFKQFWDDAIFDYLVSQTNNFAKQFIDENLLTVPKNSCTLTWFDTSVNEIKAFVGLLILQIVNSKSQNSMYFSNRESISTPFLPKIMSGRRFNLILKFLPLADNSQITPDSPQRKLAKIKLFIDLLLPKFRKNFIPYKQICIDESLLGWKGMLCWVQYMPSKRKKFGIKFYVLCDSKTGYVWNFFYLYRERYRIQPFL